MKTLFQLLVIIAFATVARAADPPTTASAAQIAIDNFTFDPPALTVPVGTRVTWTNHDDVPHTATAKDGSFKSKALDTDDTFSFVFASPGTYTYFCAVHPHMTGKIVVVAGEHKH